MKTLDIHQLARRHHLARRHQLARRPLLAGCAALAAGGALAYGLTVASAGNAGTTAQLTAVLTSGTGAFAKTVTQVQTVQAPGITGVNSLAAPPAAPAQLLPGASEIPVSPSVLSYTNGWTVSDGPVQMSVYAGSDATDSSTGMLVMVTNNLGAQSTRVVTVAGAGALTITGATPGTTTAPTHSPLAGTPGAAQAEQIAASARPESRAENGQLQFTSASGSAGTLNLQAGTTSAG